MRVVSLKMNSNVYPLKNTNSHYLLHNTTIIPLCNSKISLIFLWGSRPIKHSCSMVALCNNSYLSLVVHSQNKSRTSKTEVSLCVVSAIMLSRTLKIQLHMTWLSGTIKGLFVSGGPSFWLLCSKWKSWIDVNELCFKKHFQLGVW